MFGSKKYLFLIGVTLIVTLGGLLFGFDMAVISGAIPLVKDQFNLSAALEGWFVSSALLGAILGVAISGELSDRFGRKPILILSGILFSVSAFGCAIASNFSLLIFARIAGGIGVGIASNVAPLYISEIAPSKIRGALVTCYQLAITLGILVAYISNSWLLSVSETMDPSTVTAFLDYVVIEESWRGMFGIEVIPALTFSIGLFFVPESPRWLFENDYKQKARSVLESLLSSSSADQEMNSMQENVDGEETDVSYRDLLRPGLRKALFIGIALPLFSQFSGINAVIYYGPRILNDAGFDINSALTSQIYLGLANMLFTFIAIWFVDRKGRRPLYIYGTIGATISLFFTGLCFYMNAVGSVFLLLSVLAFLGCFAFSIGPLKFVVASEIFPNKIRGRALAISIITMWIADMAVSQITPILLENINASGTFWVFASFCLIGLWVVYKYVPETKDKTLEEIQQIWKSNREAVQENYK